MRATVVRFYVEIMNGRTALLAAVVISLAIAGCGGGGQTSTRTTSTTSTSTAAQSGGAQVLSGPVHARLRGESLHPIQGRDWAYSVRVSDASGRPLSGTVEIQFVFGDQVVGRDTPPSHPIRNGVWQDRLTFPAASVGQPLTFRAVVHTSLGSVTLDWPIRVKA